MHAHTLCMYTLTHMQARKHLNHSLVYHQLVYMLLETQSAHKHMTCVLAQYGILLMAILNAISGPNGYQNFILAPVNLTSPSFHSCTNTGSERSP